MSNTSLDDDLELEDEDLEARDGETETDLVKRLRKQIRGRDKELKELRPLKDEVSGIRLKDGMASAFDENELAGLTERQKAAIAREAEGDLSSTNLRKVAEELKFVDARIDPREQELEGHERIERAGAGAASSAATKIDRDVISSWSQEKLLRFREAHPDAWESLKRGETVTGIAF